MFFSKKKENPILELRNKLLNGEIQIDETTGNNHIKAVIIDVGTKNGAYCLVVVSDGSCSLYLERGGGIIGAGQHKNVHYVSKILLNYADSVVENPVSPINSNLPKDKIFFIHIMTETGNYEFTGHTDDIDKPNAANSLFLLGNSVITQLRLLDERKNSPFSDDEILINFIKENNYNALVLALDDLNNPNAIVDGKSILMYSIYNGNKKIVEELINKGADKNYKDSTGLNCLMIACYLEKIDLINEFINDDTIDSKDKDGQTPLMFACNAGKFESVKVLITNKANVNEKDNQGSTPIMFAAQYGYDPIVRYLLENGADKSNVGNHGFKAIDFAIQNKHKSTVKLLSD